MPRESFEADLTALKERLLHLGAMVADAQQQSVQSLADRDEELARAVIAGDQLVNQAARRIEEQCLFLIASQQPVARDLRTIISISAIASELERMADHAKGIAVLTLRLSDQPLLKPLIDVPRMAEIGRELLQGQLQAFVKGDVETAKRLASRDTEVDQLNEQVFRELLVIMLTDPRTITRATYLMWVAHNLERFADRTTNIGERVAFLMTGEIVELNE
ncbi:MAG: phosphate transport system regulatory protein PhoU [Anaerolineae bacterium CG2_30_64_16]|nr:MAG: phosphate transport system regulatory protein PhoU [Anaerolineae bacterium CG2_30_64_16]